MPQPPIPPSESEAEDSEVKEDCEEKCTAENTPNILYDAELDCNWVYDDSKNTFKCVKQNCKWVFDDVMCDWNCESLCPVPEIPEESEGGKNETKEEKDCTKEGLCDRIAVIETALGINNETLGNKSFGAALDKANKDILDLYDWVHDIYSWLEVAFNDIEIQQNKTEGFKDQADLIRGVKDDIKENGLFLGDKWWVGQQNDNLYAIDVDSTSYYTFEAGKNQTL